ncbi:uncharacterized protein J4E88_008213 [Alternaria novae-zelandiae]|uniref:uncharacterized protein n=1 Tax=Alternaria novae-zelandiae TaxID=430562 RepID=UPI0020C453F5|nr:uncharacterized protein J4E88_008213 [Alternaria novae-zelandiae]KAI4674478.1 hypothetical protein J4E88_008213 [Alternaria novae-zelandiae]
MADVARPRALGSRKIKVRPAFPVSGRDPPPRTARVGQTLPGSIVVRLRTTNADTDEAVADSTNLVAVAALVPGPNTPASVDTNALNALLTGRVFDSIHPFNDDEADGSIASMDMADPHGVGYMRFPELVIRQAGTYRIRITLIRIRSSATDPPVTSAGNGLAVHVVDSNPIVVNGGGSSSNMAAYNGDGDVDDGGWLDVLRSIQDRRISR